MRINQYACISLTQDYQKKGDIPDCNDQWIILNKAQCIRHKLQEYEPIVGPGKLDSQNTVNQFTNQTPNSSSIFTILNDKLLIAYKQQILQYDCISDLFSTNKYQICMPQQQLTITQGNVISLHSNQNQLIVRTDNGIILYKYNNSNFTILKTYNYQNIKQLNIENNKLFLCLADKLVEINLINYKEDILKNDNKIAAGYLNGQDYYFICEDSNQVKNLNPQKRFELEISKNIVIKAIFVINKFICVCGYETKFEPMDEDDEEPATYSAHIIWFDMSCNQPIRECGHLEVDLISDTNNKGDFGIVQISDLHIVYGSNLRIATFWTLDKICQQAKRYENSDEKLELLQHSEIRGFAIYKSNPFIGFGMNQKSFRCIERNPNICVLDKKGGLQMYEFLNFKKIIDYQINQPQPNNSMLINNNQFINQFGFANSQKLQKTWEDIKFTLIESLKKEINVIANPPFNLQLVTQNQHSQMVFGSGKINYVFRLHQNTNPSANLALEYKHYQIIGHEREIIILTPIILEQILSDQQPKPQIQKITSNPNETINSLTLFMNNILIQTNTCLYLVNEKDGQWNIKSLITQNDIKRVQVLEQYILLKISKNGIQQVLYEYKQENFQYKASYNSDAGCLFQLDGQIQLLLIIDDQLFISKDFVKQQLVQIDIKIMQSKDYFIAQLHENHIYISFANINESEFNHYILQYDSERNQAKQEEHLKDILENLNINDHLTEITELDWNIRQIKTIKAKFIVIFPNGVQEGFIFQVCGNDLRTIDNEQSEPIQLSSYCHYVKGISILNYVLPSEEKLGQKPGLCLAKQQKDFQYQMQPSILIYEFDEKSTLTIHRLLLIKLDQQDDSTPLLLTYEEKQQSNQSNLKQQKTPEKQQDNTQKQVQQQLQPPKRIIQVTNQLQELCKQSVKQLNEEQDFDLIMKPYFPIFTSQKFLDQLYVCYNQLENQRKTMKQKTRINSSVQDFYQLRKSFELPKLEFRYDQLQTTLTQLSKVEEQFSWICNFVINTLQMNPIRRNKITFGEFEFPSIHHITPKKQTSNQKAKNGRKIVFSEFYDQESQAEQQTSYIERLCQSHKSKIKYLQLNIESNNDNTDINIAQFAMQKSSFGMPSSKYQKSYQNVDNDGQEDQNDYQFGYKQQLEINQNQKKEILNKKNEIKKQSEYDLLNKNNRFNNESDQTAERKSEISSQQQFSDTNNKVLTRTKGGIINQGIDQQSSLSLRDPLQSETNSIAESQILAPFKQKVESKEVKQTLFEQCLKTDNSQFVFGSSQILNPTQEKMPQKTTKIEEPQKQEGAIFNFSSVSQALSKQDDKFNSQVENTNNQIQSQNQKDSLNQGKSQGLFNLQTNKTEVPGTSQPPKADTTSIFALANSQTLNQGQNENPVEKQQKPIQQQPSLFNSNIGNGTSIFSGFGQNVQSSSAFLGINDGLKDAPKDTSQQDQNKKKEDEPLLNQVQGTSIINNNQDKSGSQEQKQIPQTTTQTQASSFSFNFGQTNVSNQQSISNQPLAPPQQIPPASLFPLGQQEIKYDTFKQNQPSSFLQTSNNQAFQGLQQTIGLPSQFNQSGPLNLNAASFGSSNSIFDQKNSAPPPQQKITFSNLQNQNAPNSIGGLFGQTTSGGFIQTGALNYGFDTNSEKPRK
ncbi:unnamed protein product [Paramecium sonneborni]|uniref:Uncharacterized protein n=1 Tax=Paramecium sonneborni TaxID=65129 RepID=A0A8S1L4L3_9CILI|nr:unnamed protein product [Paramecium sonneborni]